MVSISPQRSLAQFLHPTCLFILIVLTRTLHARVACPNGLIGNNCDHLSLYSLDCFNQTGSAKYYIPDVLRDHNDSTCYTPGSSNKYQDFSFQSKNMGYILFWIYISSQTSITSMPHFMTEYKRSNGVYDQFYTLKLTNKSILLKPNYASIFDLLFIYLDKFQQDICTLEISLGRNLAPTSVVGANLRSGNTTIDGHIRKPKHSFHLYQDLNSTGTRPEAWFTRLPNKARVNLVRVFSDIITKCQNYTLRLTFENPAGSRPIFEVTDSDVVYNENYTDFTISSLMEIIAVTLRLPFCHLANFTDIYEVMIFGEYICDADFYGLACERYCPHGCGRTICDPNWGCPNGCNKGWEGIWCDRKKTTAATTTAATTTAATTTATTTAATTIAATTTAASTATKKQDCRFRYGIQCQHFCPDKCAGLGECDKQTGECSQGCKAGYHGHFCKTRCWPGTFGVNCNKHCLNCIKNKSNQEHSCDPISGQCLLGCIFGYRGDYCETLIFLGDVLKGVSSVAIAGVIIVLLIVFYKSITKEGEESKDEREEEPVHTPEWSESWMDDPQHPQETFMPVTHPDIGETEV